MTKNRFHCCIWYGGRIAGVTGLPHIDWANRKSEIGYWLGQEFQGEGIMTRCIRTLINYLFESLELNRVEIHTAVENKRSQAIPERLGFFQEGIIRDGEWLYDHYVDMVIYGLLRRDWKDSAGR
jgi:ribosomal-protein-serine acetyltransferase